MTTMIQQVISIRKKEILHVVVLELIGFLFGFGLMLIIKWNAKEAGSAFPLGTLFAVFITAVAICIIGAVSFVQDYNDAVVMSRVRKNFVPAYALLSGVEFLILLFLSLVLFRVEKQVYLWMGKQMISIPQLETLTVILLGAGIILMSIAFQLFIGALLMRFGRRAFWTLWVFWMLLCIAPGRMANAWEGRGTPFGRFCYQLAMELVNGGMVVKAAVYLLVMAVFLVPAILILRKQKVLS